MQGAYADAYERIVEAARRQRLGAMVTGPARLLARAEAEAPALRTLRRGDRVTVIDRTRPSYWQVEEQSGVVGWLVSRVVRLTRP